MTFLLHAMLERTAAARPDHPAIREGKDTTDYRTLAAWSAAIAGTLRALGVKRGDRVGIHAKKTSRTLAAVFGVLRAGAAYVPLDPGAPPARVSYAIENAGIRVLVTSRVRLDELSAQGHLRGIEAVILLDESGPMAAQRTARGGPRLVGWDAATSDPERAPALVGVDTDLAYILYTSGSTGVPKGVAIDHRASTCFVSWAARRFELVHGDRVTSHAPLHFDLSTFDVFSSVAAGATIVIVPEGTSTFPVRFAELIERERITVTYLVPSALSMMAEHGELTKRDLSALRTVLFAGEVFAPKYLRAWLEHAPKARFYNLYGPTETNVCTYHEVDREDARTRDKPVSIGGPIENVDTFVIDEDGAQVTATGAVGELWVRGACLARGYFGDAEKTARAFVPSPLHQGVLELAYRTGDRVRIEEGGTYEFLGRNDHLVKTRGYRVELGEIETTLGAHPAVSLAAAVPVPDPIVGHLIRAFVVLADGVAPPSPGDLEQFCAERLPRYMLPESIEIVAELPLTSSGKTDRRALLESVAAREEAAE
ncbi:amino acid adenylation domain-containing protein [Sandaracinus amylolyticus]|uniref:amino acid adenylation domain-containing protein n=1 Tax=Sandaracinus amylolyticus TaxID=927083 RepID=UPI001F2375E0|nr:amino acid adenylation domain-containing protein [Sandaracinus amylolyticus]UJR83304.1 Hypothetical protein I5071_53720 [Sandaracinus amylolyticus]